MAIITKEDVAKLYLATFGRPLDSKGLEYWTSSGAFSDGTGSSITSMEGLSASFAHQEEYFTQYPKGTSDKDFINSIYQNLFQRDPDAAGLEYWLDALSTNTMSRDNAILIIINGALDTPEGNDLSLITNRANVALYLAEQGNLSATLAQSTNMIQAIMDITDDLLTVDKQKVVAENLITPPTNHSVINDGLGVLSDSNTQGVASLDSNTHWDKSLETISFSFNESIPTDYYEYGEELTNNWSALNTQQKDAVRSITNEINELLGISLKEVSSGGLIEFNLVQTGTNVAGFSFYPGTYRDYAGDVFLSQGFNDSSEEFGLKAGEEGWLTIVHELGHALGLKHPFKEEGNEPPFLPTSEDDINHSVMSYTSFENHTPVFTTSGSSIKYETNLVNPSLYSLYDVATLQSIYGVNTTTNTEDTIYKFQYTDYTINTIWDAGGEDTIDLSSTLGTSVVHLQSGSLNSADQYSVEEITTLHQDLVNDRHWNSWIKESIIDLDSQGYLYLGHNNLAIAQGTVIENILTGAGDDTITDNEVNNRILTGLGDDKINIGQGGLDYVDGGEGNDILYINLLKTEIEVVLSSSNNYRLTADSFEVEFTNIEGIHLSDNVLYTPELLIA